MSRRSQPTNWERDGSQWQLGIHSVDLANISPSRQDNPLVKAGRSSIQKCRDDDDWFYYSITIQWCRETVENKSDAGAVRSSLLPLLGSLRTCVQSTGLQLLRRFTPDEVRCLP